jgi:hypothetical protein
MQHEHPGATWLMGRLLTTGKLGLRRIPEGLRHVFRYHKELFPAEKDEPANQQSDER